MKLPKQCQLPLNSEMLTKNLSNLTLNPSIKPADLSEDPPQLIGKFPGEKKTQWEAWGHFWVSRDTGSKGWLNLSDFDMAKEFLGVTPKENYSRRRTLRLDQECEDFNAPVVTAGLTEILPRKIMRIITIQHTVIMPWSWMSHKPYSCIIFSCW